MVRKNSLVLALSLTGCFDMRVSAKLETGNAIYSKSTSTEEEREPKNPELGFWEGIVGLFNSAGFTELAPIVNGAPTAP